MAKLYKFSFVLLVIACICCYLYGVINVDIEIEPNACRMTYMYGQPMYARVDMIENHNYPNYGLYYYYEGLRRLSIKSVVLNGAPVIFVPGNAGSYKQVRSLASVALRKGMHNDRNIHLNYFTVDYDEELSALYGGYLPRQQAFLKHCIKAVLALYKGHSKVVLIGHSMGGKLAQSILTDRDIAKYINTIIYISTPLDVPVLNLDTQINDFYTSTDAVLQRLRTATIATNKTNVCGLAPLRLEHEFQIEQQNYSAVLDNILLISTGGGNRDLLVRSGLTTSKYIDIHAMTSAIPKVGISCDHLSAVWCLQFMLVINRFLFGITSVRENFVVFSENKATNLQTAKHYFVKPHYYRGYNKFRFRGTAIVEKSKFVFNKRFDSLREEYNQLINIARPEKYRKMFVNTYNVDEQEWLYGCVARTNKAGGIYCDNVTSLAHQTKQLPLAYINDDDRSFALLDLQNLRKTYKHWTHILIQLPMSRKSSGFNVDLHDPNERTIVAKRTAWYSLKPIVLLNETKQDTVYYKIHFAGITDPFQALRVDIEPLACKHQEYQLYARLCVPWAAGFDRAYVRNKTTITRGIYVNVPTLAPPVYNTTINPVALELQLDPVCRYKISYHYSIEDSMSRLVLEFSGWLPAHLIAVLFIVLKQQMGHFEVQGTFKSLRPYTGYFQYSSLCLVTACRLLRKLVMRFTYMPEPEKLNYAIPVSIILHSSAIMLSIVCSFVVWYLLTINGNIVFSIARGLMHLPLSVSSILFSIIPHLPVTFGVITIALAYQTCSAAALMLASIVYFIVLTNAYKDYLEDLLWRKTVILIHKTASLATSAAAASSKPVTNSDKDNKNGLGCITTTTRTTNSTDAATTEAHKLLKSKNDVVDEDEEKCLGLQNFPYHMTLFLLLVFMCALNIPAAIAWSRAHRLGIELPDPALVPSVIVLAALCLLWHFKAPNKLAAYRFMHVILYLCATFSLLYCQVATFRLNYIIAALFAAITLHEFIDGLVILIRLR